MNTNEQVKQTARRLGAEAKTTASRITRELTAEGEQLLAQRKDKLVDGLAHLGSAARRAAEHLHEQDDGRLAQYATTVAERLDQATEYLGHRELSDLLHDAEGMVRRRPGLFFAGMFLTGLGIARFLRASHSDLDAASDPDREAEAGDQSTNPEVIEMSYNEAAAV